MVDETDYLEKLTDANDFIWEKLQEEALCGEVPSLDKAAEIVRGGCKILLDAIVGSDAKVEDHLDVKVTDESPEKDFTKVAFHLEAKSDSGAVVVQLFGYEPPKASDIQ